MQYALCFSVVVFGCALMVMMGFRNKGRISLLLSKTQRDERAMRVALRILIALPFALAPGYMVFAIDALMRETTPLLVASMGLLLCSALIFSLMLRTQIISLEALLASRASAERSNEDLRIRVDETHEEIARQSALLAVVNDSASRLLAAHPANFEQTLRECISMIADKIDVDRVHIWRYRENDGQLYYEHSFEWINSDKQQNHLAEGGIVSIPTDFAFVQSISSWESKFANRQCVNAIVSQLSAEEQARLRPIGVMSLLAVPVYLEEKPWGFVSFDDCDSEHTFSVVEENVLRSGSLMLAYATERNENEGALQRRYIQQEAMARIAQRFVSKGSAAKRVDVALREIGELLSATRVLISVLDEETGATRIAYSWSSGVATSPSPVRAGFVELITKCFPLVMPLDAAVPTVYCDDVSRDEQYRILDVVGIKSFVWAPLYVDNVLWGVISVEKHSVPHQWTDSDRQLISMTGAAISSAVSRDMLDSERVLALDQAVQASKAKGDFLSNMSHEMRTPMNAIIGMTAIGKTAPDIERKDYAFEKIESASTHMLGVINDILDISKIEANRMELSFSEFHFEKMLQKVVNVVNFRVEKKSQSFTVFVDNSIPKYLIGDDQRLAQVIANLLSNAVKFTPEHGSIHLDACATGERPGYCTLLIRVKDSGIGISGEQQSRLFTSFGQAESSTSRKFGGTGLGLAISKRIVELMGGHIWIESELGHGATFAFEFEARVGTNESAVRPVDAPNWSDLRILVVDDAPDVCEYFKTIVSRFDLHCDVAIGGKQAIEMIESGGEYHFYFIDWNMPGMNGIELTRWIKGHATIDSFVIMTSSTDWSLVKEEAESARVDQFISKPLFPSAIADAIHRHLGTGDHHQDKGLPQQQENDNFAEYRILLAEDVEINREIVISLLEPTGLRIDCAVNGAEAVNMYCAAPERYDMVFMDIQMPEMDGYEATRKIRAMDDAHAKWVPIVAMTANVFREDIDRCLDAGMDDHVGKPLDLTDVLEKLRKYLIKSAELAVEHAEEVVSGEQEIVWRKEFETGNEQIDMQHKQLFKLRQDVADACAADKGAEVVGEALEFLVEYTVKHFNDEEALQRRCNFYDYKNHRKLHRAFRLKVGEMVDKYRSDGSSVELSNELNSMIVRWLVHHIKVEDFKIVAHMRRQAAQGAHDSRI